jgi:uncharacterized protein YbjQ (UPF0145 family)
MPHQLLPDRPVDEARSRLEVEQGRIPLRAQRRIYEMNHPGPGMRPVFTSTLSPRETLACSAVGLFPISQVMGSSMFHVGFRGNVGWSGGELRPLTLAYERARSLALSRMQQEAALLGAHAVGGVTLRGAGYSWGEDLVEFTAVGTAVRFGGAPPPAAPALTLMEADELLKLHRAGYWPVAIAMGNCFWYDRHADCSSEGSWFSNELPSHTQAAHEARELAVQRFRAFAAHFNADGVVGVRVFRRGRDEEWGDEDNRHNAFHLELVMMGTAVVKRADATENLQAGERPLLVMDLRDRPKRRGE